MEILFHDALIKMAYNNFQLTTFDMSIYEFNGLEMRVEKTIRLPITMGIEP